MIKRHRFVAEAVGGGLSVCSCRETSGRAQKGQSSVHATTLTQIL